MPDTTTIGDSQSGTKAGGNAPADEIRLPLFVSAEAAVKSKRQDYVSLFDPQADLNELKKCRSDPALMKEAVKKLKEVGFKVTSIGRFSVRIEGPPKLYSEQFGAKLTMVALPAESPGGKPTDFAVFATASNDPAGSPTLSIPIPKTSSLADSIASVFLDPPAAPTAKGPIGSVSRSTDLMTEKGKKRNEELNIAYLDEISTLLGGGDPGLPTGRGVEVAVLDDDVRLIHKAFDSVPNIEDIRSENESFLAGSRDESHGTIVVGAMLAVAGGIGLRFIKSQGRQRTAFSSVEKTSQIVNCSWGEFALRTRPKQKDETDKAYKKAFIAEKRVLVGYWKHCCEIRPSQLFVWTAGNFTASFVQGRPAQAYLSSLDNVIVVGGAFPIDCTLENQKLKLPPDGKIEAASMALGGMRYLPNGELLDSDALSNGDPDAIPIDDPDTAVSRPLTADQQTSANICGLFGLGLGGILLPTAIEKSHVQNGTVSHKTYDDGWIVETGTSFAAPQVAAVAAMVLERWPRASPADVKQVLVATATPITEGASCEKLKLWDDTRGVYVGLVHIGRALILARFCAAVSAAKLNVSAKGVIKLVRDNSKRLRFKNKEGDSKLVLNDPPQATLLELSLYGALNFLDKSIPN